MNLNLLILCTVASLGAKNGDLKLIDAQTGDSIAISQLADSLCKFDVIFFGEHHDYEKAHKAELELLKELHEKCGKIAVGMEMFERDVQDVLDRYLKGEISEEEFLNLSRPWPNYQTDYRPIIEFAKSEGIPVIASNVPRRIAQSVAHEGRGVLDSLPDEERKWVADTTFYDSEEYRARFFKTMRAMEHTCCTSNEVIQNFYEAQCVKDATMAESILRFLDAHPDYKILHINGCFHSDFHLGIVYQLQKLRPNLKVVVISTVSPNEEHSAGDYILIDDRAKDMPTGMKRQNAPKEKAEER